MSVNGTYYAQIPSWYSDAASNSNPDNTDQAKALIDAGKYAVELYAYIGESRKAIVCVNVPNFTSLGWCLFGNFALTEYAKSVIISEDDPGAPADVDYADITLTRTLQPEIWNTFSVPFDLSASQLAASVLNGASLYAFSESDESSITFAEATAIEAGKPYLLKLADDAAAVENPVFNGVSVVAAEGETDGEEGSVQFVGQTYAKSLAGTSDVCYLSTDTKVKRLADGGSIKGLRAYFIVPATVESTSVKLLIPGLTDGIGRIDESDAGSARDAATYYDLTGRRLSGNQLRKGIYIRNGQKVLFNH